MVELFTWDITEGTTARINHVFTSDELSAILTECEKYHAFILSVEAHYHYGGDSVFAASDGIATTKAISDFLNATTSGIRQKLFVVNGDVNSSLIQLTKQTDGLHIMGGFQTANVTSANVTLKIYGLIL